MLDRNNLDVLNKFNTSTLLFVSYDLLDPIKCDFNDINGYSIDSKTGISFNGSHLDTLDELIPKFWEIQPIILSTLNNGIQEFDNTSFHLFFTVIQGRYRINSCVSFLPASRAGSQITYICKVSFSPYHLKRGIVYYVAKHNNEFSFKCSHEREWKTVRPLQLTNYEKQVFRLCICGLTEKRIACDFCISEARVKQLKKSVIKKLLVSNMTQAAMVNEIFNLVSAIPKI